MSRFEAVGASLYMNNQDGIPSPTDIQFETEEACQAAVNALNSGVPVTFIHLLKTGDFYWSMTFYPKDRLGGRQGAFHDGLEYSQKSPNACYDPYVLTT